VCTCPVNIIIVSDSDIGIVSIQTFRVFYGIGVARACCFCFHLVDGVGWTTVWLAALVIRRCRSSTSIVTELVNRTRYEHLLQLSTIIIIIHSSFRAYALYILFIFFCFQNGRVSTVCCLDRASAKCCHVLSLIKPIPIRLTSSRAVHFTRSSPHA